jgi:radical SAM superfamily enzyme YgiQ (UPF0313 family)
MAMPHKTLHPQKKAGRQHRASQQTGRQETGGRKKKWTNRLPIGLIYANHYAVGMSNLGFQLVYELLNNEEGIVAERIFLPEDDRAPTSVESGRLPGDFPILLFSVSFEADYLNLIRLLILGDILPFADVRRRQPVAPLQHGGLPLIIGGGVATFINPEPLAPFIDCFILGEAEPVLPSIADFLRLQLQTGKSPRAREPLLLKLAQTHSCCYVPQLYTFSYSDAGRLEAITPTAPVPRRVKRALLSEPAAAAGHSHFLASEAEFADLYMTELGRGCSRGCRFCAAGFVYRPPRLWPAETIVKALEKRPPSSKRIGLLGMEMIPADDLKIIAEYLLKESCQLSFSSLRADAISKQLLELLGASGLKTSAIAPDGGSERLRRVINKGITENDLLQAAAALINAGVSNLKLYFMIGLPTEEDEDIREMVSLIMKIKQKALSIGRRRGSMSRLTLSINCFIPKPWTPFQFHPFTEVETLKRRLRYLRQALAGEANISIKAEKPEKSLFQALLARGDRRLGPALHDIALTGKNWQQALKQHNIQVEEYAGRPRQADELLPWEIIDQGISKKFLWNEYRKALRGQSTSPCDTTVCKLCGVCRDR